MQIRYSGTLRYACLGRGGGHEPHVPASRFSRVNIYFIKNKKIKVKSTRTFYLDEALIESFERC